MADRLLILPEVAEMLRRPEATLRFWRHVGEGPPSFKLGRRIVYREAQVIEWITEQQRAQGVA